MAITKYLEIKINGDKANFTEKFYIYQNDRGIELNIKVVIPNLQIGRRYLSLLRDLNDAMCKATIQKPNKEIICKDNGIISNDMIIFTIDHELTDDLDEVGFYKIQFHIYDSENNRITIPPVEFEVKSLIGIIPDTI